MRKIFDGIYTSQWIEFRDANGNGLAQPDFFVVRREQVILFEAKLTQNSAGISQIDLLYRPLLREIYSKPVVGVLVFKNIVEKTELREISSPLEIMDRVDDITCVWHYIG